MTQFIMGQADYLYFLHGLGLILTATISFIASKTSKQRLPLLALFTYSIFHGLSIWIEMAAFCFGDNLYLHILKTCFIVIAFGGAAQFVNLALGESKHKNIKPWLGLCLIFPMVGIISNGMSSNGHVILATLNFAGSLSLGISLFILAKHLKLIASRLLCAACIFFLVESISTFSNIVIPAQPPSFHNYMLFISAISSILIAEFYISYRILFSISERNDLNPSMRNRMVIYSAVILVVLISSGWWLTNTISRKVDANYRTNMLQVCNTAAASFNIDKIIALSDTNSDISKDIYNSINKQLSSINISNPKSIYSCIIKENIGKATIIAESKITANQKHQFESKIQKEIKKSVLSLYEHRKTEICGPFNIKNKQLAYINIPIINPANKRSIGSFGMLIDASSWSSSIKATRLLMILLNLIICILTILTIVFFHKKKSMSSRIMTSEENYRTLIESSPNWVSLCDFNGNIITINQAALMTMGWKIEDIVGINLADLWPEDSRDEISDAISVALAGIPVAFETQCKDINGNILDWNVVMNPVKRADDSLKGFVAILSDITNRKRVEEQLRKTHEELEQRVQKRTLELKQFNETLKVEMKQRELAENSNKIRLRYETGLAICSQELLYSDSSDVIGEALVGLLSASAADRVYVLENFDDKKSGLCMRLIHDICDPNAPNIVSRSVLRKVPYSESFSRWANEFVADKHICSSTDDLPDSEKNFLSALSIESILLLPIRVGDRWYGILGFDNCHSNECWSEQDIKLLKTGADMIGTYIERKTTEAYLKMQTSAINAASDQIIITDNGGRIEFVNPSFERETGFDSQDIIGSIPSFLTHGTHSAAIWNAMSTDRTWRGEINTHKKDGTPYIEEMTVTPVKNECGDTIHFVAIKRDVTEKKSYEASLDKLAHHDHLTGLPNRLLFSDLLTHKIDEAKHLKKSVAVMFVDLDRFKLINDALGHNVGDDMLKEVSDRLKKTLRDVDTIARMGGDEFTVIVSELIDENTPVLVAERILECLSKPFFLQGRELFISASVGISVFPNDGKDVETLVKNADVAMYRAKEQGRSNFQFYTKALNSEAFEKMNLESNLRKALKKDEFLVYYQPRVEISTGTILGAEALVRWQHPKEGLIMPGRFIQLAEETGLIAPIGEFVLRTACQQTKIWQDNGWPMLSIAVNVSARQFQKAEFLSTIRNILDETGIDPSYLDLEITESTLMQNPELAAIMLQEIKSMGIKISLDDFGTGYSSLSYLKRFPIDTVKIDQSFVKDITSNNDDSAIATAVIAMAHSLKLNVIAEGVETLEQLNFLHSLNCNEMQGYLVSRPVSAENFAELLPNVYSCDLKLAA